MIETTDFTLNPHQTDTTFAAMLAEHNVRFSAYLPEYALLFVWYGGEYIDIGYASATTSTYEQVWEVTGLINTFDYDAGESRVYFIEDFLQEIVEWIDDQEW